MAGTSEVSMVETSAAAAPKRSLAEIVAAVKQKGQAQGAGESVSITPPNVVPMIRRRAKRAANGTRRFINVTIKLEPEMISQLDKIGAEKRLCRSELLRQAAQHVWLSEAKRKV